MIKTASELLTFFYLLPKSEQEMIRDRLSSPLAQFDDQRFSENYKGTVIDVYRSQESEKIHGGECWSSTYVRFDGVQIDELEWHKSPEKCLEVTRFGITWELEQDEIIKSFKKLMHQFKSKGFTDAGILSGLADALHESLDDAEWQREVAAVLEKAVKAAQLPERMLP